MNVLDENFPDDQRQLLQRMRIRARKIGRDIGRKAMDDSDIIPLLHQLDRPTFFTLDVDFMLVVCATKHIALSIWILMKIWSPSTFAASFDIVH